MFGGLTPATAAKFAEAVKRDVSQVVLYYGVIFWSCDKCSECLLRPSESGVVTDPSPHCFTHYTFEMNDLYVKILYEETRSCVSAAAAYFLLEDVVLPHTDIMVDTGLQVNL